MPVWKGAMNVAIQIFDLTVSLPRSEDYGFTSQVRRSALSISANIAEGFGRSTSKDKIKFILLPEAVLLKPAAIWFMAKKLVTLNPMHTKPSLNKLILLRTS